jgi:hypothetical protein
MGRDELSSRIGYVFNSISRQISGLKKTELKSGPLGWKTWVTKQEIIEKVTAVCQQVKIEI